jgi:hypothetical protein
MSNETLQERKMTDSMTNLNAHTEEQLQQMLAALLSQARDEVLNEAEVQAFQHISQEIQRRSLLSDASA